MNTEQGIELRGSGTWNVGTITGKTSCHDEKKIRYFVCAGDQVEGQQDQKLWRRLQVIFPRCGWKETWSRGDSKGRIY